MVESAPVENVDSATLSGTQAVGDMSFWHLFLHADIVVKLVIIGLVLASVWCWAIIFDKYSKFKSVKFKTQRFETNFWSGNSVDQMYEKLKGKASHPIAFMFIAAMEEIKKSAANKANGISLGLKDRVVKAMQIAKNRSLEDLENRIGFLATVGSTAPFVGLFGTVWGIMNSFSSIASAKNVSLAVVAPGIAEALFATAIGLAAAIPAVIAYNKFSTELDKTAGKLDDFSDEFITLVSRQIDEGKL